MFWRTLKKAAPSSRGGGAPSGAGPSRGASSSEQTSWRSLVKELVLPVRIPALFVLGYALYNTNMYYKANEAWQTNARFNTVRGRLLDIKKMNYFYNAVPRYSVRYEYYVDGKRYESRRATTGSVYRDWMGGMYNDTITESQYLQAIPILRIGEPCTVYYDRKNPQAHASLAADGNSTEIGILLYLAVFPLIFANSFRMQYLVWKKMYFKKKMRVGFPAWAHQQPGRGPMPNQPMAAPQTQLPKPGEKP